MANAFASALGSLASIGLPSFAFNQVSSAINSKRAWKYQQRAMRLQDELNRNFTHDYYGINRSGLVDAGYNPLLALPNSSQGAVYNPSTFNSDSDNGSQAIQSAMSALQVKNETKLANSQVENQKANSALAYQQAETEKSKRVQMEFQNSMYDVQKHLAQKDLDWYERKAYTQLYNMFQQAENYKASSAIGAMNAETQRQAMINDYNLGKEANRIKDYEAHTGRKRSGYQNFRDYMDVKYGNPLKTAGFAWDKNTWYKQYNGNYPDFW